MTARGISTLFIAFILLIWINCALAGNQWREALLSILTTLYLWPIYFAILAGWAVAWQREEIGGTLLTIGGIVAIIMSILNEEPDNYWVTLIIGIPFLVSGILFLICWRKIRKQKIPRPLERS
jgi:uncharacterized membrane protein HdeD (DUF308 family)